MSRHCKIDLLSSSLPKPTSISRNREAFTLVEILVVMVIIGLMGGMVLAAVQGVTNSARAARTRTIIAACDSVIQEQYESYKYRPLPVQIPTLLQSLGTNELGREVLVAEAARARLIMLRDLQRMELPDRFSDFGAGTTAPTPSNIWAAASPVLIDASDNIVGRRNDLSARKALVVNFSSSAKVANYQDRYASTNPSATTAQILQNQSAECLFMIMSNSFDGGTPAISAIPSSNIGDTDGDWLPEILDGWGVPIGFVRWPVGYFPSDSTSDPTSPDYYANNPDDFDLFRADYAYAEKDSSTAKTSDATDVNNSNTAVKPWSMRPLILSAGADGEFGIAMSPYTSIGAGPCRHFLIQIPR
ncbi:type II secretion system protein [Rhodopirellula sallentina]|uniref:Signal peptide protein n=1 Tax=Rhodopirellula sallentina SM41 TaxID=1263870 RepID=M5UHM0_9BACT|nr:type II secretion system protein [Rhodopirellula sallentina]EMI55528.1 signal peptide protein [Rhodopirellula sallentina SM41]